MTETQLKGFIRQSLDPVIDSLVEVVYTVYKDVLLKVPSSVPSDQVEAYINNLIKGQMESLTSNIKLIDIENIANKMKE